MIYYIAAVVTLTLVALVAHALRREMQRNELWDVLEFIKTWRESGRVQRVEADHAKVAVQQTADTITQTVAKTAEDLTHKIEEVPAKVAEVITRTQTSPEGK